ncbi:MAG: 16S rRNA (uracil(1498)-N(3))-methyltransferase [Rhodanobacteraceae bacterium]
MRKIRIYIDRPLQAGDEIALPAQAAMHVARVLRLRAGDALTLFNGDGCDYDAELTSASSRDVRARILAGRRVATESPLRITLAQTLARGEKMDWIVQKATELGVTGIVPLITERCEVRLDAARVDRRIAHWRAVGIGACEQSGRARLPEVTAPQSFETWLASLERDEGASRLALLPESESSPRDLDISADGAILVVGPEGGFGERDIAAMRAANFRGLKLGPRILRTETAGLAAIAALQALYGDF